MDKIWLSDQDVAEHYGVSRQTIWTWARSCKFPKPAMPGGKTARWHKDTILEHDRRIIAEAADGPVCGIDSDTAAPDADTDDMDAAKTLDLTKPEEDAT